MLTLGQKAIGLGVMLFLVVLFFVIHPFLGIFALVSALPLARAILVR